MQKFYNPSEHLEHLALDEIIVLLKGRVVFIQYISKKNMAFRINIFKLCDCNGYTNGMKVYLEKDRQRVTLDVTATHVTVKEMTRRVEGRGQKLYMDNFSHAPTCLMI
jgi:hypothetical protein